MNILKRFWHSIATQFIPQKLAVSLRRKHDTRLLKTMDDYKINFDLDSKIAWNRHRMRELFEMYKKIENYYPLFFAFLGFLGIYYFDFIVLLINKFNCLFFLSTILTSIGLIWALYYMTQIMFTKEWYQDSTPEKIYKKLFDEMTIWYKSNNGDKYDLEKIDILVRESYLDSLEENIKDNTIIYLDRKSILSKLLKVIFVTLLIYSFNIIYFKNLTKMANEKPKPDREISNEEFERKLDKTTTLTVEEIKQLINEEIDNYFENKKKIELNEGIKNIKKNF